MTIFARGWVETYDASDDLWDGVIRVDFLTPDGQLYCDLFGVRAAPGERGLVGHRGFPDNACELTVRDFEDGGPFAPTWATQNELLSIPERTIYEDWHMLLELMTVLARYHRPEYVRLVMWFN